MNKHKFHQTLDGPVILAIPINKPQEQKSNTFMLYRLAVAKLNLKSDWTH